MDFVQVNPDVLAYLQAEYAGTEVNPEQILIMLEELLETDQDLYIEAITIYFTTTRKRKKS